MGKIATELEAYNIGGTGSNPTNKCCTRARAGELGCFVSGYYTSNRLVQFEDLCNIKIQGFTIISYSLSWKIPALVISFVSGDSTLYYYGGSQSTDSDFTLSWSGGNPTYNGNTGIEYELIYLIGATSVTQGQQIILTVGYGGISKSASATVP